MHKLTFAYKPSLVSEDSLCERILGLRIGRPSSYCGECRKREVLFPLGLQSTGQTKAPYFILLFLYCTVQWVELFSFDTDVDSSNSVGSPSYAKHSVCTFLYKLILFSSPCRWPCYADEKNETQKALFMITYSESVTERHDLL